MNEEIKERIDMINRGEVPEGYKKTKVGIIPEEWEESDIKNLCEIVDYRGKTPTKTEDGAFLLTAKNIKKGYIDYNTSQEFVPISDYNEVMRRGVPKKGDVVITTEAPLGNVAQIDNESVAIAQRVIKLRGNKNRLLNEFLMYYLLSEEFQLELKRESTGTTVKGIKGSRFKKMKVHYPSFPEQQKIAQTLSTWDQAIELKEKLIEEKKEQKKGLMQNLLTGKVRLPGFEGEWEEVKLGDVSDIKTGDKNNKDKVENGEYPFYVRSENIERIDSYSYDGEAILIPGDGRVGVIYHYINGKFNYHQRVYKVSDFANGIDGKYVYYYLKQFFHRQAMKYTVKATVDSLRMSMLTEMLINSPSPQEQKAIANVLSTADKEIDLHQQELEQLKQQKKGLMQLLLTGKVRVNY